MKALIWIFILFVFSPIIYLLYAGLNNSEFMSADFRGITLTWLTNAITNARFLNALGFTLLKFAVVGLLSCLLSLILGLVYYNSSRWLRGILLTSLSILFVVPPTAYCLNLLSIARALGFDRGLFLTIIAQTSQALPAVAAFLIPILKHISLSEFEAAVLLGAPIPLALGKFVGKKILNSLLLAFSIGGYISLDDLVANVYVGGMSGGTSITKLIWESMRSDINPSIAWYSLTLTVVGAIVIAQFVRVQSRKDNPKASSGGRS
jgi:ABC-type spermidine/putrescine transport system permease subunit II